MKLSPPYRHHLLSLLLFFTLSIAKAQVQLAFQGGEPGNNWNYISSGADATAQAQAFLMENYVSGTQSIVVGGNTGGGSCIDGGSGNGPSVARFFTFDPVDISSSSNFFRTLSFHWGNRHPVCVGTGWDTGENLVFTAYHNGVAQPSVTLAVGNNNTAFNIDNFSHTHTIPPCVTSFYFHITITTNRRDELLFLDNVTLTAPQLNGPNSATQVNQTICQTQLPYNWNGLIFNQAGTQSQTLTNSFGCDSVVNYNLFVNTPTTPTFNNFGPFCSGASFPNLPTTSNNGISGSWSPSINNTSTTTYTFTPNAGQCANATTTTIVITQPSTPTFAQIASQCQGANIPNLPNTSQNNISGAWSPAINNQQTTTYTFTPSSGQCANGTTMTIEIIPNVTPVFSIQNSYCEGASIPPLPTTSTNNITGTWSPAINNQQTTSYTFIPATNGQCALNTNVQINIQPNITPQFNPTGSFCVGATIPPLPNTSLNGISGTWSPAINNMQTTTYNFTPSSGAQCALSTTLTIPVANYFIPSFTFPLTYCQGAAIPAFPSTSQNGINGNWSPVVNNQQTTTYTFTPLPNQCAETISLTVQILPNANPTFNALAPQCAGVSSNILPNTSLNNITGTWTPQFNSQVSGTYTFIPTPLSSGGQCANTVQQVINIIPNTPPAFNLPNYICFGDNQNPLPNSSTNGIPGTWSPTFNNQQTTNYTFIPNSNFCSNTVQASIQVIPKDSVVVQMSICQGQLPYNWQGNTFNAAGSYVFHGINLFGCDSTTVLQLTVTPNPVSVVDTAICPENLPFQFFGQSIYNAGTYQHTSNTSNGCDTTYVLNLTIQEPLPVVLNQSPVSSCNEPLNLNFSIANANNFLDCAWMLNGVSGNSCYDFQVLLNDVDCYTLEMQATDINGCVAKIIIPNMACIYPNPLSSFSLNQSTLETGLTVQPVNLSQGAINLNWDFGDYSPTQSGIYPQHTYENSGNYNIALQVSNEYGCTDEFSQLIQIIDPLLIYIPNTFTPGGGDLNEVFKPIITSGVNPYNYRLLIFNRWGETMFESLNPDVGWDGSYGGTLCPSGVYVWKIDYENNRGVKEQQIGHVNLLR